MNRDDLIIQNLKLVYSVYNHYFKNTAFYIDREDLIGEGMVALVNAADTYIPNKKKFSTYAYVCIKNAMINYCNKEFRHKDVLSFEDYIKN